MCVGVWECGRECGSRGDGGATIYYIIIIGGTYTGHTPNNGRLAATAISQVDR